MDYWDSVLLGSTGPLVGPSVSVTVLFDSGPEPESQGPRQEPKGFTYFRFE